MLCVNRLKNTGLCQLLLFQISGISRQAATLFDVSCESRDVSVASERLPRAETNITLNRTVQ